MPLDEVPEVLEVALTPGWINDEIAGHAEAEASRDIDARGGFVHGRILDQIVESLVGCRFETEKDVEVPGQRTPRVEQRGVTGHEIDAALHQNPPFSDTAAAEFVRQFQTPRCVM